MNTNYHRPAVAGLTNDQLDKVIDLFELELLDDEMTLSFSDLHDLFDPNALVHDLIADEVGEKTWAEMLIMSNGVSSILDAEATMRRGGTS